jgi:hypothetical protein
MRASGAWLAHHQRLDLVAPPQPVLAVGDQLAVELLPSQPGAAVARPDRLQKPRRQVRRIVLGADPRHPRGRILHQRQHQGRRPRRRRHQLPRAMPEPQAELQHVPGLAAMPPLAELVAPGEIELRAAQAFGIFRRKHLRHRARGPDQPAPRRLECRALGPRNPMIPEMPSIITSRASPKLSATSAMRPSRPSPGRSPVASACTHSAPARVLPEPRPPIISQVRQSPSGGNCSGRAVSSQSWACAISVRSSNRAMWAVTRSSAKKIHRRKRIPGAGRCRLRVPGIPDIAGQVRHREGRRPAPHRWQLPAQRHEIADRHRCAGHRIVPDARCQPRRKPGGHCAGRKRCQGRDQGRGQGRGPRGGCYGDAHGRACPASLASLVSLVSLVSWASSGAPARSTASRSAAARMSCRTVCRSCSRSCGPSR